MAVIGDTTKFVTMAEMRIASVETTRDLLRVGVISNKDHNPVITGYSASRPKTVQVGETRLEMVSSLDQLQAATAGWFWDYQSKLWHVKVEFSSVASISTRTFQIS